MKVSATLLAVVTALISFAAPVASAAPPPASGLLTQSDYSAQYNKVNADLQAAKASQLPAVRIADGKKALADLAPIMHSAVLYGGTIVYVDNRLLRSSLTRALDPKNDVRLHIIDSLAVQAAYVSSQLTITADGTSSQTAANEARAVLRAKDFSSDPFPPPTWSESQLNKIGDAITKFLKKLFGSHAPVKLGNIDPNFARAILIIILIAAAAIVLTLLVQQLQRYSNRRQQRVSGNLSQSGLALNELEAALVSARDFTQLMLMARSSSERGDHRTGYRLVFLATLVLLDTTGDIRIKRSRTNWEYLDGVRETGKTDLYAQMLPLTEDFDRIWYGFGNVDAVDFAVAVSRFDAIKSQVLPAQQLSTVKVKVANG